MAIEITIKIEDVEPKNLSDFDPNDDRNNLSIYARYFDESSCVWTNEAEYNLMFLKSTEQYANDILRSKGSLFLNEVYDMLGIPRSKAGQVVGWIYDESNPVGDNYVDFGIFNECNADFINEYKRIALLDFNVDGVILDKVF